MIQARPIFDRLTALADPTRSRLLLLLDRHELTVSELCAALQLPQSTVSRHLKTLADEGWVSARAEGTSRRYAMPAWRSTPARGLWQLVRDQVGATPSARQDLARAERVLQERRTTSQAFFSSTAGQWDRVRAELYGARADLCRSPLSSIRIGRGRPRMRHGQTTAALAPFVSACSRWTNRARCSPPHASASDFRERRAAQRAPRGAADRRRRARRRHAVARAAFRRRPSAVLRKRRASSDPAARLLIVDMVPHDREEYRRRWASLARLRRRALTHGSNRPASRHRASSHCPRSHAKGPALFTARAIRSP